LSVRTPATGLLCAALSACASQGVAPALLVPDSVLLRWDAAWDGDDDGLAALVPVDVMAYDAATGAPLADVLVSLTPGDGAFADDWTDVAVLRADGVRWRSGHRDGDSRDGDGRDGDSRDEWETSDPVEGELGPQWDEPLWWDARRDAFFVPVASVGAGDEVTGRTDVDGVVRFYLLVDALVGDVPVTAIQPESDAADRSHTSETFLLVPR
jgi:hypothetical protein